MDERTIYIVFSNRRGKFFGGTTGAGFPGWTSSPQDAFWFLSRGKAYEFSGSHEEEMCEIREFAVSYPDGREAYIKETEW